MESISLTHAAKMTPAFGDFFNFFILTLAISLTKIPPCKCQGQKLTRACGKNATENEQNVVKAKESSCSKAGFPKYLQYILHIKLNSSFSCYFCKTSVRYFLKKICRWCPSACRHLRSDVIPCVAKIDFYSKKNKFSHAETP